MTLWLWMNGKRNVSVCIGHELANALYQFDLVAREKEDFQLVFNCYQTLYQTQIMHHFAQHIISNPTESCPCRASKSSLFFCHSIQNKSIFSSLKFIFTWTCSRLDNLTKTGLTVWTSLSEEKDLRLLFSVSHPWSNEKLNTYCCWNRKQLEMRKRKHILLIATLISYIISI